MFQPKPGGHRSETGSRGRPRGDPRNPRSPPSRPQKRHPAPPPGGLRHSRRVATIIPETHMAQAKGITRLVTDVEGSTLPAVGYRAPHRIREFFALTKPRVVSLIVFTAVIGMFLATPGIVALQPLLFGAVGIALVAGSAAAMNCLLERNLDAQMARTRARPLAAGRLDAREA